MRRRRGLTPEDAEIWAQVARTAHPMHPKPRVASDAKPKPAPVTIRAGLASDFSVPDFRVGQAAPTSKGGVTRAQTPAQHLAAASLRMDHKTHRKMTQGKMRPEARIDLHGMTLAQAFPELVQFVMSCHASGLRLVLVITGKGSSGDPGPLPTRPGALRHQVPHWLHSPPLSLVVQQVTAAHYRHGGEGAYYVYLRRIG
ncbi:Smr/MutS family protein [Paracoccus sp. (in: a-proteobacteria)]|uniref:Smr/MutS family protein n=1 Tax=Paracoccus sp. TaxID=267 RepID=UPI0026DFE8DA|nr:Smr/MutS family protein [Paracoccus sp. (in: a-proteobacteria)]MDO5648346.1 Smr/MutS family protein [Paracoccus sp. (in: a-proteobacteria)]